jgi:hypothetical protein
MNDGAFPKTRGLGRTGAAKAAARGRSATALAPKTKSPDFPVGTFLKKGGDILSHRIAVPSAQAGLTSLFGMGRGEPRRNNHLRPVCEGVWPIPNNIHIIS